MNASILLRRPKKEFNLLSKNSIHTRGKQKDVYNLQPENFARQAVLRIIVPENSLSQPVLNQANRKQL